jgi:thiamine transport system substrate-binding protein
MAGHGSRTGLDFTSPVAWRSEDETHHSCSGIDLGGGRRLAQTPVLTVYTYDSFIPDWGPGPAIEAAFEEVCGCDLQFVGAGDGAAVLSRIRLEGARTEADVVIGLDTNLTAAAAETGLFAEHGIDGGGADPASGVGRSAVPALRLGLFRLRP